MVFLHGAGKSRVLYDIYILNWTAECKVSHSEQLDVPTNQGTSNNWG